MNVGVMESFSSTVVIKATSRSDPGFLTLMEVIELLNSDRYTLEVAVPHDSAKDDLTLIFTEKGYDN